MPFSNFIEHTTSRSVHNSSTTKCICLLFITILGISILSAGIFSAIPSFAKEKEVSLDSCPAPVKKAVEENIARSRGKLEKIEKEKKDGAEFYDARIVDANGKRWALKVSPEGAILETKEKAAKK